MSRCDDEIFWEKVWNCIIFEQAKEKMIKFTHKLMHPDWMLSNPIKYSHIYTFNSTRTMCVLYIRLKIIQKIVSLNFLELTRGYCINFTHSECRAEQNVKKYDVIDAQSKLTRCALFIWKTKKPKKLPTYYEIHLRCTKVDLTQKASIIDSLCVLFIFISFQIHFLKYIMRKCVRSIYQILYYYLLFCWISAIFALF